jgi:quercetin dioxygenase-like cupin family protein
MRAENTVDLHEVIAAAGERSGVVWALRGSEDLNANLVRFASGWGVDEHTNAEVDVIFVGVFGSGVVTIDGDEHPLSAGTLIFVPKGSRRSTKSTSEDFAYLTVHRRRGPLRIGARRNP